MAQQPIDLEALRAIFADKKPHIALALIVALELADDRSHLKAKVSILPEKREFVARMTWESAGADAGFFQFPQQNDLVLVAFPDGDENQCFVIKRLSSVDEKIPLQAVTGNTALVALPGKKMWISSAVRILLSKGSTEPEEPLVLGNQLRDLLSEILEKLSDLSDKIATHTHVGNLGYPTDVPQQAEDFETIKSFFDDKKTSPVDDDAILSDIAFTEKGS